MTTQSKHTPGPWFMNGPAEIHTRNAWQMPVACVFNKDVKPGSVSKEAAEANARLIAAARNAIGDDFPIEKLEAYEFGGLKEERDALLDAAQEALDELILCWGASIIDTDTARAINGLRKAISKARGE